MCRSFVIFCRTKHNFYIFSFVRSNKSVTFALQLITNLIIKLMARPIKETPILFGEDARKFEQRMHEDHKIDAVEYARMQKHYQIALDMLKRGKEIRLNTKNVTV